MSADDYKGTRAELLKTYRPKIIELYGVDEFKFIKDETTGPGGVDRLRNLLDSMDAKTLNRGGMVKKKKPMKANKGGTPMAMGKAKMAKKKMRGGGMAKRKMMGGGMAKMSKKKKMMRGGMAKKKK